MKSLKKFEGNYYEADHATKTWKLIAVNFKTRGTELVNNVPFGQFHLAVDVRVSDEAYYEMKGI